VKGEKKERLALLGEEEGVNFGGERLMGIAPQSEREKERKRGRGDLERQRGKRGRSVVAVWGREERSAPVTRAKLFLIEKGKKKKKKKDAAFVPDKRRGRLSSEKGSNATHKRKAVRCPKGNKREWACVSPCP